MDNKKNKWSSDRIEFHKPGTIQNGSCAFLLYLLFITWLFGASIIFPSSTSPSSSSLVLQHSPKEKYFKYFHCKKIVIGVGLFAEEWVTWSHPISPSHVKSASTLVFFSSQSRCCYYYIIIVFMYACFLHIPSTMHTLKLRVFPHDKRLIFFLCRLKNVFYFKGFLHNYVSFYVVLIFFLEFVLRIRVTGSHACWRS